VAKAIFYIPPGFSGKFEVPDNMPGKFIGP